MKRKFTSRDLKFFLLGFFTLLLIETVLDWKNNIEAFKEGFKNGSSQENMVTNPPNE